MIEGEGPYIIWFRPAGAGVSRVTCWTTEQMDWLDDHNPEWQARLRREREQHDRVPEPHDEEPRRFRVRPMFAWYDFWVGVFYDRRKSALYVFPVPMLGVRVSWGGME